jgi:hypothetical protein
VFGVRCRLMAPTPLEVCQLARNLLLVAFRSGRLLSSSLARSRQSFVRWRPCRWRGEEDDRLASRMADCHANVNACPALPGRYALDESHSLPAQISLRKTASCWTSEGCFSAELLLLCLCSALRLAQRSGRGMSYWPEGVELRFMSLCCRAMRMQRWLARCWRSACFALLP